MPGTILCPVPPQDIEFCGGDYTGVVPPVPISNTEVKYTKADGSVMNARVGSRHLSTQSQNNDKKQANLACFYFCVKVNNQNTYYERLYKKTESFLAQDNRGGPWFSSGCHTVKCIWEACA